MITRLMNGAAAMVANPLWLSEPTQPVIKMCKEVGYPYMLMPDHVPLAADNADPGWLQSSPFCYGYIRGLIQFVCSTT